MLGKLVENKEYFQDCGLGFLVHLIILFYLFNFFLLQKYKGIYQRETYHSYPKLRTQLDKLHVITYKLKLLVSKKQTGWENQSRINIG